LDVINKNRWDEVHYWIAALKYCQNAEIISILKKQKESEKNQLGFSFNESLKILICPDCEWRDIVSRLNLLDFVIRDITFAGTIGIHVDIDGLIKTVSEEENPNWLFIESIQSYLLDTLYEDLKSQTASALYQRALTKELINDNISLPQLFGLNTDSYLDDDSLQKRLFRLKAGTDVFNSVILNSWKTWNIDLSNHEEELPKNVECAIIQEKKILTDHLRSRVICFLRDNGDQLGLAYCYEDSNRRPQAKNFLRICKKILFTCYPNIRVNQLHKAMFEGIINKQVTGGFDKNFIKRLAELDYDNELLKNVADYVRRKNVGSIDGSKQIAIRFGDVDVQYREDRYELLMNMMYAAISSGKNELIEKVYPHPNYFKIILWSELIQWQSVYFGVRPSRQVIQLLKCAQEQLCKNIKNDSTTSSKDLEYYSYLESLIQPNKKISLRYSAIDLKILKDEKKTENEYDVVSILLVDDRDVEIWIWGVTTNKDINSKKRDDLNKIEILKNNIQSQWKGDVKIVVNYVYKKGSAIICDIDGRIESRSLKT